MSQANIQSLFQGAKANGSLSAAAANVVMDIPDIGSDIQAGIGLSVDDIEASEVTIFTQLIDDSGSIRAAKNEQVVRDGHNLVLDTLNTSKQKEGIFTHTRYLNGTILYSYVPLSQAVRMNDKNYTALGGTPFYDQTAIILGTVVAKVQEFAEAGVPCRSVTALITDGFDQGSVTHRRPEAVEPLITELLSKEMHIIAGMGIDDGQTDFTDIFSRMGIRKEWILTPKNSPSEIRKAFGFLSQTALRASQAAGGNFSKVAAGGFGN